MRRGTLKLRLHYADHHKDLEKTDLFFNLTTHKNWSEDEQMVQSEKQTIKDERHYVWDSYMPEIEHMWEDEDDEEERGLLDMEKDKFLELSITGGKNTGCVKIDPERFTEGYSKECLACPDQNIYAPDARFCRKCGVPRCKINKCDLTDDFGDRIVTIFVSG